MDIYNEAFRFLLQIKRVKYSLDGLKFLGSYDFASVLNHKRFVTALLMKEGRAVCCKCIVCIGWKNLPVEFLCKIFMQLLRQKYGVHHPP